MDYPRGPLIAEGKTKKIYRVSNNEHLCLVVSKDDITAGDGAKHDVIPNKGVLSNRTTCNNFGLLKRRGVAVAFEEQVGPDSFVAPMCHMLPYEVVVRREAHGSYLKSYPIYRKGDRFSHTIVQFFLKTKDKNWKGRSLVCDDPLMEYEKESKRISLYDPKRGREGQNPFLVLGGSDVFERPGEPALFLPMCMIAARAFTHLEKAWESLGYRYVDYKVEFGLTGSGELLLADVIDNDSGRLVDHEGKYVDKQYYREGGSVEGTKKLYKMVADLSERFACA